MAGELDDLRARLDEIDLRLLEALAQRKQVVMEVAARKATLPSQLRDRERERALLTQIVEAGRRFDLDDAFVTAIFRELIEYSLRLQQDYLVRQQNPALPSESRLVVAYQGVEGSYSHAATTRYFAALGRDVVAQGFASFGEMLDAVQSGQAEYGVLPIENTTAGSINESYDLLAHHALFLVGEVVQKVDHCLLALEAMPVSHIRRVYSHPQALAQCSAFLSSLRNCHAEAYSDTALAALKIKQEQDFSQAAIAGEEAARIYGLTVLKRGIANQRENYTRMVVVARQPIAYDLRIPCKTSLIFATSHEEGALLSCLQIFAEHGLNLTKLESRPRLNTPWQYLFYVDFEGNLADAQVQKAVERLSGIASYLKVLGSYPARTTKDAYPSTPHPLPARLSSPAPAPSARSFISRLPSIEAAAESTLPAKLRAPRPPLHIAGSKVGEGEPLWIVGPQAVDSLEQLRRLGERLRSLGVQVLSAAPAYRRALLQPQLGKPETLLHWFEEVGRECGLALMVEVEHAEDVERKARHFDLLQVNERDMQNFELLRRLGQVDRPVLLQRGMIASLDEWLAAAECILEEGNQQLALCETGVRSFEARTRNKTLDLAALAWLHRKSTLPVLVDLSSVEALGDLLAGVAPLLLAAGASGLSLTLGNAEPGAEDVGLERLVALLRAKTA